MERRRGGVVERGVREKVKQVEKVVVKVVEFREIVWDAMWRKGGQLGILASCTNTIIDTKGEKWNIPEACLELSPRRRRQSPERQAYWCFRAFQKLQPGSRLEITRSKEPLSNGMNVLVRILPRE